MGKRKGRRGEKMGKRKGRRGAPAELHFRDRRGCDAKRQNLFHFQLSMRNALSGDELEGFPADRLWKKGSTLIREVKGMIAKILTAQEVAAAQEACVGAGGGDVTETETSGRRPRYHVEHIVLLFDQQLAVDEVVEGEDEDEETTARHEHQQVALDAGGTEVLYRALMDAGAVAVMPVSNDLPPAVHDPASPIVVQTITLSYLVRTWRAFEEKEELRAVIETCFADELVTDDDIHYDGNFHYREPPRYVPLDVQVRAARLQAVELEYGPIRVWDVSAIQDYSGLFCTARCREMSYGGGYVTLNTDATHYSYDRAAAQNNLRSFNADISGWNVSGGKKTMSAMFLCCQTFNQPLNEWDTSGVEYMDSMFEGCYRFNQSLSKWDVRKVVSMQKMFSGALAFEGGDIGAWELESCREFRQMFLGAENFDQGLEKWAGYLRKEREEGICLHDEWFPDTIHTYQMFRGARKFLWREAYEGVFPRPIHPACSCYRCRHNPFLDF